MKMKSCLLTTLFCSGNETRTQRFIFLSLRVVQFLNGFFCFLSHVVKPSNDYSSVYQSSSSDTHSCSFLFTSLEYNTFYRLYSIPCLFKIHVPPATFQ